MSPLPSSGPGARILVTALREYSNSCPPGDLHPDCPFAVRTKDGLGCGEECLDLLAEFDDVTPASGISIGPDIRIAPLVRPRARIGPSPNAMPFDSGQLLLEERRLPLPRQSPTSVLLGLLDGIGEPPPADPGQAAKRAGVVHDMISELYRRGFDADALLHEVYVPALATMTATWVMVRLLAGDQVALDWSYVERSGWAALLLDDQGDLAAVVDSVRSAGKDHLNATVARLMTSGRAKVEHWMATLSLDELVAWRVPTAAQYEALEESLAEPSGPQVWVMERFINTYLDSWSTESLHHEWAYIHGKAVAPCGPAQMRARRIAREDLACAIANRATGTPVGGLGPASLPLAKYVGVAVELLQKGERASAAAIFDVACNMSPRAPEPFNNRGFCRLPDEPDAAVHDFEKAIALGLPDIALATGNRMLALHRLGRNASAMAIADELWMNGVGSRSQVFVWDFRADTPTLISGVDSGAYVADLATFIAEQASDDTLAAVWRARLAARQSPPAAG